MLKAQAIVVIVLQTQIVMVTNLSTIIPVTQNPANKTFFTIFFLLILWQIKIKSFWAHHFLFSFLWVFGRCIYERIGRHVSAMIHWKMFEWLRDNKGLFKMMKGRRYLPFLYTTVHSLVRFVILYLQSMREGIKCLSLEGSKR